MTTVKPSSIQGLTTLQETLVNAVVLNSFPWPFLLSLRRQPSSWLLTATAFASHSLSFTVGAISLPVPSAWDIHPLIFCTIPSFWAIARASSSPLYHFLTQHQLGEFLLVTFGRCGWGFLDLGEFLLEEFLLISNGV